MRLSEYRFEELLPEYLTTTEKGRVKNALEQFFKEGRQEIDYSNFYVKEYPGYLMQGDLLNSVYGIRWDNENNDYSSGYTPALLISNSCDVSELNERTINQKNGLFAPILKLDEFIQDCKESRYFSDAQIQSFVNSLKKQELTNLFYLPTIDGNCNGYIVRFDMVFWVPVSITLEYQKNSSTNRRVSLSHWAHMLFLVKYSFHSCRVPETQERPRM